MKNEDNLDFDISDLKADSDLDNLEFIYNVVYIKFSKYSKLYAYLIENEVKIGSKVWIPGKNDFYEVKDFKVLKEDELPLRFDEMKYAYSSMPVEDELKSILNKCEFLKLVNKKNKLIGRDDVLENLLMSVNKKRMKNSVLIGDAGCGKTSIVEEFSDLVKDEYFILSFSVGELIAGTTLRGMLEEKIADAFNSVLSFNQKHQKKIILFIDEIHMVVSNAGCGGNISIHDQLKTYLTDEDMIVIGATTFKEYRISIKCDSALMRRITPIVVNNLSDEVVVDILDNFSEHLIDKNILNKILELSKEIPSTTNPDISLEILDRAMARNKILFEKIDVNMVSKIAYDIKLCYE